MKEMRVLLCNQIDISFYKKLLFLLCFAIIIGGCSKNGETGLSNKKSIQSDEYIYTNILKDDMNIRIIKTYKNYLIVGYINDKNNGFISVYNLDTYDEIANIADDNILVTEDIICYNDIFYLNIFSHKYLDIDEPFHIYNYYLEIINSINYDKEYNYVINSTGFRYIKFRNFPCNQSLEIKDIISNDTIKEIYINFNGKIILTILSNLYFVQDDEYLCFMGNYSIDNEVQNKSGQVMYGRIDLSSNNIDFHYSEYNDITYFNNQCILNYNNSSFDDQDQYNPIIFYDIKNDKSIESHIQKVDIDLNYIVINENCVLQRITDLNDKNNQYYIYTKSGCEKLFMDDNYKNIIPKQVYIHKNFLYIIYSLNGNIGEDKVLELEVKL